MSEQLALLLHRREPSGGVITSVLIVLTTALLGALDSIVWPQRTHPVLYIVPLVLAALRSTTLGVILTMVMVVLADLINVAYEEASPWDALYSLLAVVALCFVTFLVFRLYRIVEQRADQMTRLYAVAVELAAAVTPSQVADAVVTHAAVVGARAGSIVVVSSNPDELELIASAGYSDVVLTTWRRFPLTTPVAIAEAIRDDTAIWLGSRAAFFARYPHSLPGRSRSLEDDQAWVAVPLRLGSRVIGALGLAFPDERAFTSDEQTPILALAAQCAQALDRARLYEVELKARNESEQARRAIERVVDQTTRLQTVTSALSEALSPYDVARAIVDHGIQALGARSGFLAVVTSNGTMVELVYSQGYPPQLLDELRHVPISSSLPWVDTIRTNEVIVQHTLADRIRFWPHLAATCHQLGPGAIASIPLAIDGQAIGALGLGFPETRDLLAEDVNFAVTLAHLAAQALQRSRLYEAEQTAVRQRDEFLTVAAHELKTPMTSLRGFAQLELLRYGGDQNTYTERTRHSLEIIDVQAAKMSDMIARLFDVAQIDTGKLVLHRHMTDLTAVIEEIVATFPANGHHILIDAVVTAPAAIDPLRIEQVVTNLLDNAVKYSPEGTAIEVQVCRPSDDLVRLTVRDHGMGIAPARRGHIFERYYRADDENHRSGMGLGLYICHQIVELHGGWIWAEFPDDGGTRIVVTLPVGRGDSQMVEASQLT